jgi:hypothetical protein
MIYANWNHVIHHCWRFASGLHDPRAQRWLMDRLPGAMVIHAARPRCADEAITEPRFEDGDDPLLAHSRDKARRAHEMAARAHARGRPVFVARYEHPADLREVCDWLNAGDVIAARDITEPRPS